MQTLFADVALLPGGWAQGVRVAIAPTGRIAAVEAAGANTDAEPVGVLLPAPVNLHSHSFQRAMAGLTEARGPEGHDSFWTWRALMYRFLDRLTPDHIEAIAAFAFMEMLEAGFGAVAEFHYLHHAADGTAYADPAELSARIVAAAEVAGIGLTLLPVLYEQGGCDGRPLGPGQRRFGNDIAQFATLREGASRAVAHLTDGVLGIAPHSLRAVSTRGLAACAEMAAGGPIHIHVAEQTAEVAEVEAALGARPVAWLLANAEVGPAWCAIHATHLAADEVEGLAASGAVAGLCPVTEANLGDGLFSAPAFLAAGGRFGVGTDSNIAIGLAEELRCLEYGQRLRDRMRAVVAERDKSTGRRLFDTAVAGGAQAAGRDTGMLRVGAWADLLALEPQHPDIAGLAGDRLLDSFVFARGAHAVAAVWSAGRRVVRGGRHVGHDAIARRYAATVGALRSAL